MPPPPVPWVTEESNVRNIAILCIGLSLLFCPNVFAHGDGSTLMGTVVEVSRTEIVVRTADGDLVKVLVDGNTTYGRGAADAGLSDVSVGMRVVIDVDAQHGAVATSVRLPAVAARTAPASAANEKSPGSHEGHEQHGEP